MIYQLVQKIQLTFPPRKTIASSSSTVSPTLGKGCLNLEKCPLSDKWIKSNQWSHGFTYMIDRILDPNWVLCQQIWSSIPTIHLRLSYSNDHILWYSPLHLRIWNQPRPRNQSPPKNSVLESISWLQTHWPNLSLVLSPSSTWKNCHGCANGMISDGCR